MGLWQRLWCEHDGGSTEVSLSPTSRVIECNKCHKKRYFYAASGPKGALIQTDEEMEAEAIRTGTHVCHDPTCTINGRHWHLGRSS